MQDNELAREVHKIMNGKIGKKIYITQDGVLTMKGRVCVPDVEDLKRLIMEETHCSVYTGSTKMYQIIKKNYWWFGMKKDIAKFVSRCLVCQQVKAEYRKPPKTLQLLPILEWKWVHITMDFVVGLSRTRIGYDAI